VQIIVLLFRQRREGSLYCRKNCNALRHLGQDIEHLKSPPVPWIIHRPRARYTGSEKVLSIFSSRGEC